MYCSGLQPFRYVVGTILRKENFPWSYFSVSAVENTKQLETIYLYQHSIYNDGRKKARKFIVSYNF